MASFGVKDKAVALFGGIAVVMYLVAIALTPARPTLDRLAVRSSAGQPTTAVSCSPATCSSPWGWLGSWSFAAGLYRVIRRAELQTTGSRWPRWRARWPALGSSVPGRRCSWPSPTARQRIPLWRVRFGMLAGWPKPAGFGFSAWIAMVAVGTLRHGCCRYGRHGSRSQ